MTNWINSSARSRATSVLLSGARPFAVALAGVLAASCAQGDTYEPAGDMGHSDMGHSDMGHAAEAMPMFAGIPQHGEVLGDPGAPVTLIDLSDLRCSHCRDFVELTLPVLIERYVRPGRVRIVFGNFPILGPSSVRAARMAAAVGLQDHQFEFIDVFFRQTPRDCDDAALRRLAGEVPGVDVDRAMSQIDSTEVTTQLEKVKSIAGQFSIHATPTFLLGKSGEKPRVLTEARAKKPDTLTAPIDEMLAQH